MKDKFRLYKIMQNEPYFPIGAYMLFDHTPVLATSLYAWGEQFEKINRHVKQETVDKQGWFWRLCGIHEYCWISTVFIALDHRFLGKGEPLLFETMIYHNNTNEFLEYQTHCSTWEQAEEMHEEAKRRLYANKTYME